MAAKGKGKKSGPAAIPLIPTLIMASPELMAALHGAVEISRGADPAVTGGLTVQRLKALYGAGPAIVASWEGTPLVYDLATNVKAKVAAGVIHMVARKFKLRGRLSKRFTLL